MRFIRDLSREKEKMLERIHRQSKHHQVRARAQCLLLSFRGVTIKQLIAIFGVSRKTIHNWLTGWEDEKLVGIYNRAGRGRKPILKKEQQEQIKEWVKESPKNLKKVVILETDVQYNYFDLNNTNLKGANLEGANLERANLEGTNLERANLEKVNLKEASLKEATLTGATLIGANLYRANRANLEKVNLTGVNLEGANLEGAYLGGANLEGTYFIKVKNLTSEQVKEALNWQKAFYEPRFQKELGLSSGNSNF